MKRERWISQWKILWVCSGRKVCTERWETEQLGEEWEHEK